MCDAPHWTRAKCRSYLIPLLNKRYPLISTDFWSKWGAATQSLLLDTSRGIFTLIFVQAHAGSNPGDISFLQAFDRRPWTVNEQIKIIQDFLDVSTRSWCWMDINSCTDSGSVYLCENERKRCVERHVWARVWQCKGRDGEISHESVIPCVSTCYYLPDLVAQQLTAYTIAHSAQTQRTIKRETRYCIKKSAFFDGFVKSTWIYQKLSTTSRFYRLPNQVLFCSINEMLCDINPLY